MNKIFENKLIKNTSWTAMSFVIVSIVYLLRISILTRFMSKEEFGLIALSLFILGFTNIFSDLGISTVILSKDKLSIKEYSSLYWVGLFLAIGLYLILLIITPFFSDFYKSPELNYLIPIMGLDLIITTVGRQFNVFLQKELRFKILAKIKVFAEISSLVLSLALAVGGFGIWSLVLSLLLASLLNTLGSIYFEYKEHPIFLYCNIKKTKHLYSIGLYQTGAQVLDYLSSQIDILLLGKLLPLGEMGIYSVIKALVLRIYSSINQIFTKVSVPLLSKVQFNESVLKEQYLSIIRITAILNAVVFIVVIINAEFLLQIFYGTSFYSYDYVLRLLCVWGYFSSLISCAGSIIIATGKTRIGFTWTQIRLILNPVFIVIGGYFGGMVGVCIAQAIYSILSLFLYHRIVVIKIISTILLWDLVSCFKDVVFLSLVFFVMFFSIEIYFDIQSFLSLWAYFGISTSIVISLYFLFQKRVLLLNIKKFKT